MTADALPGASAQPSKRLETLVFVRGLAALLVVVHHAGRFAAQPKFIGLMAFGGVYERFTGVNYFFVMSGFFMGLLKWKLIGGKGEAWPFAVKRMARIYPSYWIILFPLMAFYTLVPSSGALAAHDPVNMVLSVFLLPYVTQPVYGVAWTLVHELLFCVMFAIVVAGGKRAIWLLPAWGVAIVVAHLIKDDLPYPLSFFFHEANLQFLFGIAVARFVTYRKVPLPGLVLAAGASLYIGYMLFGEGLSNSQFVDGIIYGAGAALSIAGMVQIERNTHFILPKPLLIFGAASYSIYLIHPVALTAGLHFMKRLHLNHLPVDIAVLTLAAIVVVIALLFDRFFEAPFVKFAAPRLEKLALGGWRSNARRSSAISGQLGATPPGAGTP